MKRALEQSNETIESLLKRTKVAENLPTIGAFEHALHNVKEFSLAKDITFFKMGILSPLVKIGDEEFKVPMKDTQRFFDFIKFRDGDIELRVHNENFKDAIKAIESQSFPISKIWLNTCEENCDEFAELFESLLNAIESNRAITSLQIYDVGDIHQEGEFFSESKALGQWLETNTSLTSLAINEAFLREEQVSILAESLKGNSTLNSLSLYGNELGNEGTMIIMKVLEGKTNLTYLNLGLNSQDSKVIANIVESANTLPNLTHLDLSYNDLDDPEDATRIKKILEENKSLNTLNLHGDSEQMPAIITKSLIKNIHLTSLNFDSNTLSLINNIHLTSLNINASPLVKLGTNQLLIRNQKIFNKMLSIIKEPFTVTKEITETVLTEEVIKSNAPWQVIKKITKEIIECEETINNISPPYYKFFYETPKAVFGQKLGPDHPEILSKFESAIHRMFSYLSGISKNICPLPLPVEIWEKHIVAPYLKLQDIHCHQTDASQNTSEVPVSGDQPISIEIAFNI
jgi:hypothetical protein